MLEAYDVKRGLRKMAAKILNIRYYLQKNKQFNIA